MSDDVRQYASVSQMVDDLSEDVTFNEEVAQQIARREVVKRLFAVRTANGISQQEIAQHLGCSQSRVSKIENGEDSVLRLRELEAYAKALDCDVQILFKNRDATAVDDVKYHAFQIKRSLDRLAELGCRDEAVAQGVANFFGEAFFNLVKMLQDSASKLPSRPDDDAPYVHFDVQVEEPSSEPDVAEESAPCASERSKHECVSA